MLEVNGMRSISGVSASLVAGLLLVALGAVTAIAAPGDPGEPVRLNGDLPATVDFAKCFSGNFLAHDSEWVVYTAHQDNARLEELYAVPSAGGTPHKLNVPLPNPFTGVWPVLVTSDGSTVVYVARTEAGSRDVSMYAVPVSGGESTLLDGPADLFDPRLTPDGSAVVYFRNQGSNVVDVLSVPVAGGSPNLLTTVTDFDRGVGTAITPDGTRIVFGRRLPGDPRPVHRLYTLPVAGGPVVQLQPPIGAGGDVLSRRWLVSPDSSNVVLVAIRDPADNDRELFSAPLDGSDGARLTRLFPDGGDVKDFLFSPDGSRVVYLADQIVDKRREIFSVPVDGGKRTRLNDPLPARGDVSFFTISPDGTTVVYRADQRSNNKHELFSVPIEGGDPTRLNGDLRSNGDVRRALGSPGCKAQAAWPLGYGITPDSSTVIYIADQDSDDVRELFAVPIGGGASRKLNEPLGGKRDVRRFEIAPDGSTVAYIADQDTNNQRELYSVPVNGGSSTKLSGPFPTNGDMATQASFVPDSSLIVYIADQRVNNQRELFSVGTSAD